MAKILLVEDDKSLQEIYGVRLNSEGYGVLIAGDGEEALNIALKERPDLILSDVMMPKISGFDMLDILRTTPEIKDTKVIIMTALSSEDQRERGEKLGANLYLVKSQVGIEDVIHAVKTLLQAPEQTIINRADPFANPSIPTLENISQSGTSTADGQILTSQNQPTTNSQTPLNNANQHYRQPASLRDLIPKRDQPND